MCATAAKSLIDPTAYVEAVLGKQNTPKLVMNDDDALVKTIHETPGY